MRTSHMIMGGLSLMLIATLMMPTGIPAQTTWAEADSVPAFTQAELAQMLAPIALYPDSLIAKILMASTYPLEVVEAERWVRSNPEVTGEALDIALEDKDWDPSVKSLCHFPDVLFAMSDKLDQTTKLGDAYLAQREDVMATIQMLRRKAEEQGNLNSTQQQKVVVEREYIRIEPAQPTVVYVPVYNPLYVYGPWWYPAYRPWYWYYPSGVVVTGGHVFFGRGFSIGVGLFSWSWFDWPARRIYVDYARWPHFRRRPYLGYAPGKHYWRHRPDHRRGVAYRDRITSERFGQRRPESSSFDRERRGYPERTQGYRTNEPSRRSYQEQNQRPETRRRIERESVRREPSERTYNTRQSEPSLRTYQEQNRQLEPRRRIERESVRREPSERTYNTRQSEPSLRPYQEQNRQFEPRQRIEQERVPSTTRRETSFGGIGQGNFERRAAERGAQSRGSSVSAPRGYDAGRPMGVPRSGSYPQRGYQGGGQRR